MKKIIVFLLFNLLLLGCGESEKKKEAKVNNSKYTFPGADKLFKLDFDLKTNPPLILFSSYTNILSQVDFCELMNKSLKNENKEDANIKKIYNNITKQCGFYKSLYEKYLSNFDNINSDNYNDYYYFAYMIDEEEAGVNYIGIFLAFDECNNIKEDFLKQEFGFVSNCKKISSNPSMPN